MPTTSPIEYDGSVPFQSAADEAMAARVPLVIKSGDYGSLRLKAPRNLEILYEDVTIDGGLENEVASILQGDLELDISASRFIPCFEINTSANVTIRPSVPTSSIRYRNGGRGLSLKGTGRVSHEGGVFENLLARAFGGGIAEATLSGAVVRSVVLENFNHRIGRMTGFGGSWGAAIASWSLYSGALAERLRVENCTIGPNIWGEGIGFFKLRRGEAINNTLIDPSHTVGIYGSYVEDVTVSQNTLVFTPDCPRRDAWKYNQPSRAPHGIMLGNEADEMPLIMRAVVERNQVFGGHDSINIASWVEAPVNYHAEVYLNKMFFPEGASLKTKNWDGMSTGTGRAVENISTAPFDLQGGEWVSSPNTFYNQLPDVAEAFLDVTLRASLGPTGIDLEVIVNE